MILVIIYVKILTTDMTVFIYHKVFAITLTDNFQHQSQSSDNIPQYDQRKNGKITDKADIS